MRRATHTRAQLIRLGLALLIVCGIGLRSAVASINGFVDPIDSYHAAGVINTTTGIITPGSTNLVVANSAGWTAGMGISIAGAGAGGANLITTVATISGTTFTLSSAAATAASGATVAHDDTDALQAAIGAASFVILRPGANFNVSKNLIVSTPVVVSGYGATIWNQGSTNDVFYINFGQPQGSFYTQYGAGPVLEGFTIYQAPGITPTSGYGVHLAPANCCSGPGGIRVKDLTMNALWGGVLDNGVGAVANWVTHNRITNTVGYCIYYDIAVPGGDQHFESNECSGTSASLFVNQSDTTEFVNQKVNSSGVKFGTGAVNNLRFINPSIEGAPSCALDFGGSGTYGSIEIIGGEFESDNAFCSPANVAHLSAVGFINGNHLATVTRIPDTLEQYSSIEGVSAGSYYFGSTQTGAIYAIGGATPVGLWPNNSFVIEGNAAGGLVLDTITPAPVVIGVNRSNVASFSSTGATVLGTTTSTQFTSVANETLAPTSGQAVTVYNFPANSLGTYLVSCSLKQLTGVIANYAAFAIVMIDGNTSRIMMNVPGTSMAISTSGLDLQVAQNSGVSQTIATSILKIK